MKIVSAAIPKIEFPEMMLQKCTLCGTKHPIIICGVVKHPENGTCHAVADRGYSFCNCHNIWYTDWNNIDQRIYDLEYHNKFDGNASKMLFEEYAKEYFPVLKKANKNIKSFVEIGAINEYLLDHAANEGWETIGIDINKHAESNKHKYVICDMDRPTESVKADVYWMAHVFEHFKDPIFVLKYVYRDLNEDGLLFVSMPDPYFIDWKDPYNWGHWHLREHHVLWDMDSFIKRAEKEGFKCVFKRRNQEQRYVCTRDYHIILQK